MTSILSIVHDVQTVFGSKSTTLDKVLAVGDFVLNAVMDVSMLVGIGEVARVAYLGLRIGLDIGMHVGEDLVAHSIEEEVAHSAEETASHSVEETASHSVEGAAANCGGLSFAFATKVATSQGKQAIGTMHPGEKVWAYNPKTKQMELQPVLHVWINHDNDLVDLTLTATTHAPHSSKTTKVSEVIHTNKKHPFLTKEQGFVPVGQLHVGMQVREADGQYGVITAWKLHPGTQTMYNLEVAQDHTFTVGQGEWIVHNCSSSGAYSGQQGPYSQLANAAKGTDLQAHHIFQDAMMRNLTDPLYNRDNAPAILLNQVDHAAATAVQRAVGVVFRNEGLTSLTFSQAQQVAADALRAAGYSDPELTQIVGNAASWFTSNWSSSALDALRVPLR